MFSPDGPRDVDGFPADGTVGFVPNSVQVLTNKIYANSSNNWVVPIRTKFGAAGDYWLELYKLTGNTWSRIDLAVSNSVPAGDFWTQFQFSRNLLAVGDRISVVATALSGPNASRTTEFAFPSQTSYYEAQDLGGDYNLNGLLDAADYTVWRDSLGQSVSPYSGADGSGNGVIDQADYQVWKNGFNTAMASILFNAMAVTGDFNADGVTNDADLDVWWAGVTAGNLMADADGNNVVNYGDLRVWQEYAGTVSASAMAGDFDGNNAVNIADLAMWLEGDLTADADGDGQVAGDLDDFNTWQADFGTFRADFVPLLMNQSLGGTNYESGPRVLGLSLGNSLGQTHAFQTLVGTGEQLRSVAVTGPNSISVKLSERSFLLSNDLRVTNLDGTAPANLVTFVYDLATDTATWTFDAAFADGRYVLRLADTVFGLDGEKLDGEFLGPWSLSDTGSAVFPSGNLEAGGEFRFRFTVLAGDTDHNNIHGAANYTTWKAVEPGMVYSSNTLDEFDGDLSFGDLSLREAVNYANTASEPTTIQLVTGRYVLTLSGTETGPSVAVKDLDILSHVNVIGAGPGLTVIDSNLSGSSTDLRIFEVTGPGARGRIERLTLASSVAAENNGRLGAAALVQNAGRLELVDVAVVNNLGYGDGVAVQSLGSELLVLRTVFTANQGYDGVAIESAPQGSVLGSLTIGESIFALNTVWYQYAGVTPNVKVTGGVVKTNLGKNLYDNTAGGFFTSTPGVGDYLGVPHYVVTTIADTFDHSNNSESLSVREAVDKANTISGTQEIWLPAWNFALTRDRVGYGGGSVTDTSVAFGDLDISQSLWVRGVSGRTNISWGSGLAYDEVFDLLGDYNIFEDEPGYRTVGQDDYDHWFAWNGYGSESPTMWEAWPMDGDDDGDVDQADYNVWAAHQGNSLQVLNVAL